MAVATQLDLFADTQGLTVSALKELIGNEDFSMMGGVSLEEALQEIADGKTARAVSARNGMASMLTFSLMSLGMDRLSPGWDSPERLEELRPKRATPATKSMKGKDIPEEIKDLLRQGVREGDVYRLPEGQLDRKTYEAAMKVLGGIGFKWNKRAKAHVCGPHGQPERLWEVLDAGKVVDLKQELQFFATPPAVVARLLELAELGTGMRVLEPSAGTGNIAKAVRDVVGDEGKVDCCEIHPPFVDALTRMGFDTWPMDFLLVDDEEFEPYDRVVMNPPFAKGQDIEHVWRAHRLLKPSGILVAVMHPGWQTGGTKREGAFRDWLKDRAGTIEDVEAGAFKESGTDIATVIVKVKA